MDGALHDPDITRLGSSYLQIVGPIYGLYGMGVALCFATQGFGNVVLTVGANVVRLVTSAACALIGIYWLDLGPTRLFAGIALGFCAYAGLTAAAIGRGEEPGARR